MKAEAVAYGIISGNGSNLALARQLEGPVNHGDND